MRALRATYCVAIFRWRTEVMHGEWSINHWHLSNHERLRLRLIDRCDVVWVTHLQAEIGMQEGQ
jgi:hypothetical protein